MYQIHVNPSSPAWMVHSRQENQADDKVNIVRLPTIITEDKCTFCLKFTKRVFHHHKDCWLAISKTPGLVKPAKIDGKMNSVSTKKSSQEKKTVIERLENFGNTNIYEATFSTATTPIIY